MLPEPRTPRCWSSDHPRSAGLTLGFAIDAKGAITSIQIKGDSGDPFAMEAGGCVVDVALGIHYPASPTGKVTTFEVRPRFRVPTASSALTHTGHGYPRGTGGRVPVAQDRQDKED